MPSRWTRWSVLVTTPLLVVACNRERPPSADTGAATPPAQTPPAAPAPGAAPEDATMRTLDTHLQSARAALGRDANAAAGELRQAAASVRAEGERGSAESREEMRRTADDLEALAKRVEQGAVRSENDLDREYARVHHALAVQSHQEAVQAWARRESASAGEHLRAASAHLEQALRNAGRETDQGAMQAVSDARQLGDSLVAHTREAGGAADRRFTELKNELDRLGHELVRPRR